MKVGDLVFELPLGTLWFKYNPWLRNDELGLVTEVIDHNSVMVFWPSGKFTVMEMQHLETYNEGR